MHEGHRARMREKLERNPESLAEHEVLEILLYSVFPRKNTNDIAHNLLNAFGNLQGVMSADVSKLKEVVGMGETSSAFLKTISLCMERINYIKSQTQDVVLINSNQVLNFIRDRYSVLDHEQFDIFLLDKNGKLLVCKSFTENQRTEVSISPQEVSKFISDHKCSQAIVSHNHLSGYVKPSASDDNATRMLALIFNINGIRFCDHVIYSNGEIYSYFLEGKMQSINKQYSLKVAASYKEKE